MLLRQFRTECSAYSESSTAPPPPPSPTFSFLTGYQPSRLVLADSDLDYSRSLAVISLLLLWSGRMVSWSDYVNNCAVAFGRLLFYFPVCFNLCSCHVGV